LGKTEARAHAKILGRPFPPSRPLTRAPIAGRVIVLASILDSLA
jgi:hypothetical protein